MILVLGVETIESVDLCNKLRNINKTLWLYHSKYVTINDNKYLNKDSNLSLTLGYRYVDPKFRSTGSQTRRLDYIHGNRNTIYPLYTNMSLIRPPSVFDLVSDYQLYNQDLSSILMVFNPIY